MKTDYNKLNIGDRLVRTKKGIFSRHHALYAGIVNNKHMVAENQVNRGVQYITLQQFMSEGRLDRIEYNGFNRREQSIIIQRINEKIKKRTKYSLLKYNCEHFANEILTGVVKSKQIRVGSAIAATLTLLFVLTRNKNKQ